VIEAILPAGVAAVDTREDMLDVELFPEEAVALGGAVEKRRREFVTGRACARRALAQLGLPVAPIASGARGEPCWPDGVVGSITHCAGYRACALAHTADFAALGIDAEPDAPLPRGVLERVVLAPERDWLEGHRSDGDRLVPARAGEAPRVHWDRLLFSAKEAVYKAWFPLAGRWLGFEDVLLTVDPTAGSFHVQLLVPGPLVNGEALRELAGRWLARDGLLATAVALRSSSSSG
jgi:4'-phosphopantetheinyl transferase EntD